MIKIFISHSNYWYDGPNAYYCYDLNIQNYVPASSNFPRESGSLYRVFRITTISENNDWTSENAVMNQCFNETLTVYMSNSKWVAGSYSNYSNFCLGQIINKQNNTNVGYWSCLSNNFNYIRFISTIGWDLIITLESLC